MTCHDGTGVGGVSPVVERVMEHLKQTFTLYIWMLLSCSEHGPLDWVEDLCLLRYTTG